MLCKYRYMGTQCALEEENSGYCYFHHPLRQNLRKKPSDDQIRVTLKRQLEEGNGNWDGFNIPVDIVIEDIELDFQLLMREGESKSITFRNVKANEGVQFHNVRINGNLSFERNTRLSGFSCIQSCSIDGEFNFSATAEQNINFSGTKFLSTAAIGGYFSENAIFSNTVFHDAVTFIGFRTPLFSNSRLIPKDPIYRVFGGACSFENANFYYPQRVLFKRVDLHKTSLSGADLSDCRLVDVNWYQPKFKMNGLYDEIVYRGMKDEKTKKYIENSLINSYRNIRSAIDKSKDYNTASDFYFREMELRRELLGATTSPEKCIPTTKRQAAATLDDAVDIIKSIAATFAKCCNLKCARKFRKEFFSVEALYYSSCKYGTSPAQALWVLLLLGLIHLGLLGIAIDNQEGQTIFRNTGPAFQHTIQLLSLQFIKSEYANQNIAVSFIDGFFRIAIIAQLSMLAMSIRNKIKRH